MNNDPVNPRLAAESKAEDSSVLRHLREPRTWLVLLVLLGLAYRIAYMLRPFEWLVAFFTADDFYYYTATARNIALGKGSSFDGGLTVHNGYHPLFVATLVPAFFLGAGKVAGVIWGMCVLTAANAGAAWMSWRVATRLGDRWLALLPAAALSLNYFFVGASLDGFATPLVLLCLLALVDAYQRDAPAWQLGLLLGLCGMARVEASLAALPLAWLLLRKRGWRELWICAGVSLLVAAPWIVWSTLRFGTPLPESGVVKAIIRHATDSRLAVSMFLSQLPRSMAGAYWPERIGYLPVLLAGVLMFAAALTAWRRCGAFLAFAAISVVLYTLFADPQATGEFLRFMTPAVFAVSLAAVARPVPRALARWTWMAPLLLVALIVRSDKLRVQYSLKSTGEDRYIGTCAFEVPPILAKIVGPKDIVGCFDSGAVGYFGDVPVVNLDGLVNADVVDLLRGCTPAMRELRYREYFARKGITIMTGGNEFPWADIFKDLSSWKVLHPPIELRNGAEIVFLRIPAWSAKEPRATAK
jgi:hypothetical protein